MESKRRLKVGDKVRVVDVNFFPNKGPGYGGQMAIVHELCDFSDCHEFLFADGNIHSMLPYRYEVLEEDVAQDTPDVGKKFDQGKLRFDLVPPEFEQEVAKAFTYGANKYGDRNWEKGIDPNRLYAATRRHLHSWFTGELLDEESGNYHLAHAAACIAMMLTFDIKELNG